MSAQPLSELRACLKVPRHIAIIMDGNGRWAKARGLKRADGHREGVRSVRDIVEACGELGVEVLTLYTFSNENWRRPKFEIDALMDLLLNTVRQEVESLDKSNVRLRIIGRVNELAYPTRQALESAVARLSKNSGLILNLALSYGSRQEIIDAVRAVLRSGRKEITEQEFEQYLYTAGLPEPDLLIRTSGELRLSNFLLWQCAYAEIVVTDELWPEFRRANLVAAIEEFGRRKRRFGDVDEAINR
ncbi:isoprenyl transferase [candidate division KSB1 bacterium]|nr:isoprenyl transferase [candidate division KSB1 bacterium]